MTFNEYVTFVEETVWTKSPFDLCKQKSRLKSSSFPLQSQLWHTHTLPQLCLLQRSVFFQRVNPIQKKGREKKRTTPGRRSKIKTFSTSYYCISMFNFSDGILCDALWTMCQHSARVDKGKSLSVSVFFAADQHISSANDGKSSCWLNGR